MKYFLKHEPEAVEKPAVHTSDRRLFKRLWTNLGGRIVEVRRTGEVRYLHPAFVKGIRANNRRNDVPAVLLSRLNQILRTNQCLMNLENPALG
jgi:hypothetical protein